MHPGRSPITAFALGLALALAGCGSSNDEVTVDEPPLGVILTFPLDLAALGSPFVGPQPVAVTFTRATGLHEMQASIFPPTTSGTYAPNTSTRTTWTWHDIEFDAADGCYFWLIDGVNLGHFQILLNEDRVFLREPRVVRIPSSVDRFPGVGFSGSVTSFNPNVIASGTIVFIMPSATTTFNPLDPGTFNPDEATGIDVAFRADDFVELKAAYRASMLPVGTAYIAVAIKDTNDDLHYNPLDDWWGMYEDAGGLASILAQADTGQKDSLFNFGVNMTLRAPFVPAN
jgi:hypothetical protein